MRHAEEAHEIVDRLLSGRRDFFEREGIFGWKFLLPLTLVNLLVTGALLLGGGSTRV